MKKLSVLIAVLVACSVIFTGCAAAETSQPPASQSSSAPTSPSAAPPSAAKESTAPQPAEKVVIYAPDRGSEIKDWDNNAILKIIEEETNTDIQINYLDGSGYIDYLTVSAASGDFPDIVAAVDHTAKTLLRSWVDNKVIEAFEGDVAAAAPNVIKEYADNPNLTELTINGKIYMHPMGWGNGNDPNIGIIHVRKDLLDKFNMAPPDTWDQYVEYLRKCVNDEKISGLVFLGNNTTQLIEPCINAYLGSYGIPYYGWVKKGEEYEYWAMQPDTIKAVVAMRKLVEEQLVDPAVWEYASEHARTAYVSGKAGSFVFNGGGNIGRLQNDMTLVDPSLKEWVLPALDCGGGGRGYTQEPMYWNGTVIGGMDHNNPVAAARVINYLISDEGAKLTAIGIEGRDYEMNGGQIVKLEQRKEDGFTEQGAHPFASGIVSWQPQSWQDFHLLYGKEQVFWDWYNEMRANQCMYQVEAYGISATSPLWSSFQATSRELIARSLVEAFKADSDERAAELWENMQKQWLSSGGANATKEMSDVLKALYK